MSFCWCKGLVATSNCTTHQPEGYERPSILEAPEITQACNQKWKLKFGNTRTVSAWLDLHITTFSYLPTGTFTAYLESIRTIRKKYGSTHLYRPGDWPQIRMAPIQSPRERKCGIASRRVAIALFPAHRSGIRYHALGMGLMSASGSHHDHLLLLERP